MKGKIKGTGKEFYSPSYEGSYYGFTKYNPDFEWQEISDEQYAKEMNCE